jgi:hypothetical protein
LVENTGLQLLKILLLLKVVSRVCGGMGKQSVQVHRGWSVGTDGYLAARVLLEGLFTNKVFPNFYSHVLHTIILDTYVL